MITFMKVALHFQELVIYKCTHDHDKQINFIADCAYLICRNHDAICKFKVLLNTNSDGEFSDTLCNSESRNLTKVRFRGK